MKHPTNSDVSDKLAKRLVQLYNDRDFVIGVLSYASTDEDRKEVLDFIERNNNVTVETVTVLAIKLYNRRQNS